MSRKTAREIALHTLFTMTYDTLSAEEILSDYLSEEGRTRLSDEVGAYAKPLEERDVDFIRIVVSGVDQHRNELDEEIGRRAIKWQTDRISRIALSVLRMAFFEVLYLPDTDNAVAANEAVELAKKYDSKESAAFINGILGTLIREKE